MRIFAYEWIPFFEHLTVSWSLPVERIIFSKQAQCKYKGSEKSQSSDSCGFTNLLYKSLKCQEAYCFERIKQLAEKGIGNI